MAGNRACMEVIAVIPMEPQYDLLLFRFYSDFSKLGMSSSNAEVSSNYQLLNYSATQCSRLSCLAVHGNLMAASSDSGLVFLFHYEKDWSEKVKYFF